MEGQLPQYLDPLRTTTETAQFRNLPAATKPRVATETTDESDTYAQGGEHHRTTTEGFYGFSRLPARCL